MNIPEGPLLVVEDVPNILEYLAVTLRFKGYPVVTAVNGKDALEKIEVELPALIITDILMPKMDGYTLVHHLRTRSKTRSIPIIFLSATYVTPEDKQFAIRLGAAKFLEKPIDTEELLLTVAEVLTLGPATVPPPLNDHVFYRGYMERLENKLKHKNVQILRTERLLKTLPEEQKQAFNALLAEACSHREEIENEIMELKNLLKESK